MILFIALATLALNLSAHARRDDLRVQIVTNIDEVSRSVDFSTPDVDPYPSLWYDTIIDRSKNCYVVFEDSQRIRYALKSLTPEELSALSNSAVNAVLTHAGPCGVCSTLHDLAAYLDYPDMTTPVAKCALKGVFLGISSTYYCLRESVEFSHACAWIWAWNCNNTGKMVMNGGCLSVCMMHKNVYGTPNIDPEGTYNPCKPPADMMHLYGTDSSSQEPRANEGDEEENPCCSSKKGAGTELRMPCRPCAMAGQQQEEEPTFQTVQNSNAASAIAAGSGSGFLNFRWRRIADGECRNTINGKPACVEAQWRNGPFRLNSCL